MSWKTYENEMLDDYVVKYRKLSHQNSKFEIRLYAKDDRRRRLTKAQLCRFLDYVDWQMNKLPLYENSQESEEQEKERYKRIRAAAQCFYDIHKKISNSTYSANEEYIEELVDEWGGILELLYDPQNKLLRTRFLKNELYLKLKITRQQNESRLNKSLMAGSKSYVEKRNDLPFLSKNDPSPHQQFVSLRDSKHENLANTDILHILTHREHQNYQS